MCRLEGVFRSVLVLLVLGWAGCSDGDDPIEPNLRYLVSAVSFLDIGCEPLLPEGQLLEGSNSLFVIEDAVLDVVTTRTARWKQDLAGECSGGASLQLMNGGEREIIIVSAEEASIVRFGPSAVFLFFPPTFTAGEHEFEFSFLIPDV